MSCDISFLSSKRNPEKNFEQYRCNKWKLQQRHRGFAQSVERKSLAMRQADFVRSAFFGPALAQSKIPMLPVWKEIECRCSLANTTWSKKLGGVVKASFIGRGRKV
jgi:hypothetical protein